MADLIIKEKEEVEVERIYKKHANWHLMRNLNRLNENDMHANWHRSTHK